SWPSPTRSTTTSPPPPSRLSPDRPSPGERTTMTTTAPELLQPATSSAPRAGRLSRTLSLARAEVLLLVRNRTTLFNAVALAPLIVVFIATIGVVPEGADAAVAGMLVTALAAMAL